MINILIEGMTSNRGGKESYIVNMWSAMDKEKYSFSFVAYDDQIAYEEVLKQNGAEVIHLLPRHSGLLKHRDALDKMFKEKHFDVVWAHKTTLSACEILSIAKNNNVPVRIVHSHSSANMGGKFTFLMHSINKKRIFKMANEYFACSQVAAQWFFGDKPAKIMVNGINLEQYKFNAAIRENIRQKYDLHNNLVLGHVGRFGVEKNHKKLLNVFAACKKIMPNIKLILCGDGEERTNIEFEIKKLNLEGDVLLLGVISNVNEILQAMDIFVMPSLFEGLPFALLEAQAAGLKCIVSDTVSAEVDIMGWNRFLPLALEDNLWAKNILEMEQEYNRIIGYEVMKKRGFDITDGAREVERSIDLKLESQYLKNGE